MESILALLLMIGVIVVYAVFLLKYPDWLEKNKGYSPISGGRVALAFLILLCVILALASDGSLQGICIVISLASLLLAFALNFKESKSVLQATLMTLWQLMAVSTIIVAIVGIYNMIYDLMNKKKRK